MSSTSFLESLLSLPDAQLQHSLTLANVHSVLLSLLSASNSTSTDRELLHQVVARLSLLPKGALDLTLLIVYVKAYYLENRGLVEEVLDDAFSTSLSLKQAFTKLVPAALERELSQKQEGGGYEALETLLILYLVAHRHLPAPSDSTTTRSILTNLDRLYTDLCDMNGDDSAFDQLRLLILSTFASLLTLPSYSLEQLDLTLQIAASLNDSRLVKDSELHLGISKDLGDRVQGQVGRIARGVKDSVGKLKKLAISDESSQGTIGKGKGKEQEDWIERVQRKAKLGGNASEDIDESRLKTGESQNLANDEEAELVTTISSIQELLPHLSTSFLRIGLQHASFRPSSTKTPLSEASERLVSAVLENDLPADLQKLLSVGANEGEAQPEATEENVQKTVERQKEQPATTRRNIFDEDKAFSKGKLLIPGSRDRTNPTRGEISLDERLKESIIALAEAPSSDEEEEDGEAFLDDSQEAGGAIKVGVRDNGDEDDEDENETPQSGAQTPATVPTPDRVNLFTPATIQLLEQTYLSNPSVFASDSVTRRTNKQRIKLREQTGLDDNQLEGWKRMLERGGEKEVNKLRDRMMDLNARGNHPVAETGSERGGRGGANGNRGGRGGNRGGRGGGSSQGGKGDGGRAQHDRRKRGNDKKMQKMGATL